MHWIKSHRRTIIKLHLSTTVKMEIILLLRQVSGGKVRRKLNRLPSSHHTVKPIAITECESPIAKRLRLQNHLFGMRGALQKRKVRFSKQLNKRKITPKRGLSG